VNSDVTGRQLEILEVPIWTGSMSDAAQAILEWGCRREGVGRGRTVCATTIHGLTEGWRDRGFREVLTQAAMVTADGMPLVWLGKIRGRATMERVDGPTLMLRVCEESAKLPMPVRHFFYGGAPGVAQQLGVALTHRFPGLQVAGSYCPPFRPLTSSEKEQVALRINGTQADIVWVGLGTPKQEQWAAEMQPLLSAGVLLTVGAAFDFHTGRIKRAPHVLQRAGLEWAFRVWQEPRRLWRRYAVNIPVFGVLALLELFRSRYPRAEHQGTFRSGRRL
jgi:N-acetylglucosaminyldiphosphoundecaprenol N-acetyl-beta-D-mannosaminyltransferase